jgi:hypothetical protein
MTLLAGGSRAGAMKARSGEAAYGLGKGNKGAVLCCVGCRYGLRWRFVVKRAILLKTVR